MTPATRNITCTVSSSSSGCAVSSSLSALPFDRAPTRARRSLRPQCKSLLPVGASLCPRSRTGQESARYPLTIILARIWLIEESDEPREMGMKREQRTEGTTKKITIKTGIRAGSGTPKQTGGDGPAPGSIINVGLI